MYHEVVSFIAAFIKAHAPLRIADQVVFALLKLQGIDIKSGIDVSRIEQEYMGWDGKQRFRVLPDSIDIEVLQILAGKDDGTVLFTHTFHKVADIFHGGQVGKEQIKLIDAGCRMPVGQKFIRHVGKHIKQHGILHIFARLKQSLDTERQEAAVRDIRMSVKKFGLRSLTHGVKSKTDFLQKLCGIQLFLLRIVMLVFLLHQIVKVRQDRVILWRKPAKVRIVPYVPLLIKFRQHDFYRVKLAVRKILIASEKVF